MIKIKLIKNEGCTSVVVREESYFFSKPQPLSGKVFYFPNKEQKKK